MVYINPAEYNFIDIYFQNVVNADNSEDTIVVEEDENTYLINSFLNYACEGNLPYNDGSSTLKIFLFEINLSPQQITSFLTGKMLEWLSINKFFLDISVECVAIDSPELAPYHRILKLQFTIKEIIIEVAKEVA